MQESKPILLIEDDRVDAMTVQRALKELGAENQLIHTTNGEQALKRLRDKTNAPPCLILMDLNTPKMNGMEFLQIIKAEESLKDIPVVAMSSSAEQQEVRKTTQLGVVRYIVKSVEYAEFVDALSTVQRFWQSTDEALIGAHADETPRPPIPY